VLKAGLNKLKDKKYKLLEFLEKFSNMLTTLILIFLYLIRKLIISSPILINIEKKPIKNQKISKTIKKILPISFLKISNYKHNNKILYPHLKVIKSPVKEPNLGLNLIQRAIIR
jgi:p-aminobenzoyl-glutamate transporter AbgT